MFQGLIYESSVTILQVLIISTLNGKGIRRADGTFVLAAFVRGHVTTVFIIVSVSKRKEAIKAASLCLVQRDAVI